MVRKFLANYAARHQHPVNQALHWVGVPLTFLVSGVALGLGRSDYALDCFLAGYALQFLGHAIEGNDAGETVLVKKLLGMKYVAIVPRTPSQNAKN